MNRGIEQRLQEVLQEKNFQNHPFFQALKNGYLPASKLRTYAREYGAFVTAVVEEWSEAATEIGIDTAAIKNNWAAFAHSIDQNELNGSFDTSNDLISSFKHLVTDNACKLGAFYAFSKQQSGMSYFMIEALEERYIDIAANSSFFKSQVENEKALNYLQSKLASLSEGEIEKAIKSCRMISEKMWDALIGIHEFEPVQESEADVEMIVEE